MNTLNLHLHSNLTNLPINNIPLIKPKAKLITHPFSSSSPSKSSHVTTSQTTTKNRTHLQELKSPMPKSLFSAWDPLRVMSSKEHSRMVIIGSVSVGLALLLMGLEDEKALALGPGGPLLEDFWDNMRRYALYALTVSTGAIYVLVQPIVELLKNPISAVLILVIIGGTFFIVSQIVTAMVGLSEFSYDYSY